MQWTFQRRVQSLDFQPHRTGSDRPDAVIVKAVNEFGASPTFWTFPVDAPAPKPGDTVKVTVQVVDPISGEPVE